MSVLVGSALSSFAIENIPCHYVYQYSLLNFSLFLMSITHREHCTAIIELNQVTGKGQNMERQSY